MCFTRSVAHAKYGSLVLQVYAGAHGTNGHPRAIAVGAVEEPVKIWASAAQEKFYCGAGGRAGRVRAASGEQIPAQTAGNCGASVIRDHQSAVSALHGKHR
jgi:hypothetical protein